MKEFKTIRPTEFAVGNSSSRRFSVGRPGDIVKNSEIQSVRRVGWQGDNLLYPFPRTNIAKDSNNFSATSWKGSPSLYSNFSSGVMPAGYNFTRASTATYFDASGVMRTAAVNEPRIDYDPATGECLGLLVEGQATNLLTHNHTTSGWTSTRGTLTLEDGWFKYQMNPGSTNSYTNAPNVSIEAGKDYVFSALVRPSLGNDFLVRFHPDNFGEYLSLLIFPDGSTLLSPGLNGEAKYLGGGVYSIWMSAKATTSAGRAPFFWSNNTDGTEPVSFYFRDVQLEEGTRPTSYIPTEGSQVTRAADNALIPIGDWYNPLQGTLLVDGTVNAHTYSGFMARIQEESFNRYIGTVYIIPGGIARSGYMRNGGSAVSANASGGNLTWGDRVVSAISWDGGRFRNATNGTVSSVSNQADGPPRNAINIRLMAATGFGPASGGHIRRLTYYPHALTDEQLIALTMP